MAAGTPSITVLSPNGGETWQIGQTYSVVWEPAKIRPLQIQIVTESSYEPSYILSKGPFSADGKYTFRLENWWIPNREGDILAPMEVGKYKIRLVTGVGGPVDSSDASFSITAAVAPGCSMKWWFDNNTTVCSQKQFCGAYMYYGLQTFDTQADCQAALTAVD